jgi:hypothetical protein
LEVVFIEPFLIMQGFFNENQMGEIAAAIVIIAGGFSTIWTPLSLLIAKRLYQRLNAIEANQQKNGGKLDAINKNVGNRSEDAGKLEAGGVPGVRETTMERPEIAERRVSQLGRDTPQVPANEELNDEQAG